MNMPFFILLICILLFSRLPIESSPAAERFLRLKKGFLGRRRVEAAPRADSGAVVRGLPVLSGCPALILLDASMRAPRNGQELAAGFADNPARYLCLNSPNYNRGKAQWQIIRKH